MNDHVIAPPPEKRKVSTSCEAGTGEKRGGRGNGPNPSCPYCLVHRACIVVAGPESGLHACILCHAPGGFIAKVSGDKGARGQASAACLTSRLRPSQRGRQGACTRWKSKMARQERENRETRSQHVQASVSQKRRCCARRRAVRAHDGEGPAGKTVGRGSSSSGCMYVGTYP